jgi:peptidoglycan hydrolase CwlO-like protein|tara:strand:+ start:548 stop:793 length:246 start_codon:yes stop_codon:yes gene_type:complete
MIDKKISLGTVMTICTILGTFIYTQGMMTNKVESFEKDSTSHSVKINKNVEKIQELEVSMAKIESKIDEGFKRIEDLLFEK